MYIGAGQAGAVPQPPVTSIVSPDATSRNLCVDEVVVGDSVKNTAAEGATFVGADIWTDNAVFLVRNNPGLFVANGAQSFIWNERNNVPWAIDRYEEESIRSLIIRAFTHTDVKVVSSQHGYMYLDLVA